MAKAIKVAGVCVSIVVLLVAWYCVAADYDYAFLAGTYTLEMSGVTSTLILKRDQSFEQRLTRNGKTESIHGTWRIIGEGGVVFSKEFLTLGRQEARADGEVGGEFKKAFGLLPSIHFFPDPGAPVFHKKLFG